MKKKKRIYARNYVCQRISHVKGYIGANEESLTVNDLIVPADKLIPLMGPDPLRFLIDVLVRLGADVIVASFDRKLNGLERYRAGRRPYGILVLGIDLVH